MGGRSSIPAAVLVAVVAQGCSITGLGAPQWTPEFVRLPLVVKLETADGIVGVVRRSGALVLVMGPDMQALREQTSGADRPGSTSLNMLTSGGELPPATYYSWIYGNAPPGAMRFSTNLGGAGGDVVDGIFVLALEEKDLDPEVLAWAFVDADGDVIQRGRSLSPIESPSPSTPSAPPAASPSATSVAGPALRTFPWPFPANADCDAMAIDDPVVGQLAGDPGDRREPVWLERADGTRLSVVWPAGFTVRFEPDATLYDEQGRAVARAGDTVTLWQVPVTAASGSFDDPYVAAGILRFGGIGGCYPVVR